MSQIIPPSNGHRVVDRDAMREKMQRPAQKTGRILTDELLDLRVYVGCELRRKALAAGLDPDHWSSSSVTSACIALKEMGVRGISADVFSELNS